MLRAAKGCRIWSPALTQLADGVSSHNLYLRALLAAGEAAAGLAHFERMCASEQSLGGEIGGEIEMEAGEGLVREVGEVAEAAVAAQAVVTAEGAAAGGTAEAAEAAVAEASEAEAAEVAEAARVAEVARVSEEELHPSMEWLRRPAPQADAYSFSLGLSALRKLHDAEVYPAVGGEVVGGEVAQAEENLSTMTRMGVAASATGAAPPSSSPRSLWIARRAAAMVEEAVARGVVPQDQPPPAAIAHALICACGGYTCSRPDCPCSHAHTRTDATCTCHMHMPRAHERVCMRMCTINAHAWQRCLNGSHHSWLLTTPGSSPPPLAPPHPWLLLTTPGSSPPLAPHHPWLLTTPGSSSPPWPLTTPGSSPPSAGSDVDVAVALWKTHLRPNLLRA